MYQYDFIIVVLLGPSKVRFEPLASQLKPSLLQTEQQVVPINVSVSIRYCSILAPQWRHILAKLNSVASAADGIKKEA